MIDDGLAPAPATPSAADRKVDRRLQLLISVFALLTYGYFMQAGGWNHNTRFDLTRALVEQHSLRIDSYHTNTADLSEWGGHYYSDKAPLTAVLGAIPYAAIHALRPIMPDEWTTPKPFFQIASAFVTLCVSGFAAVFAALLLYRFARKHGAIPATAFAIAATYAFASYIFPFATVFFGHDVAAALLFSSFYLVERNSGWKSDLCAGLIGALAAVAEYPTAGATMVMVAVLMGIRGRRGAWRLLLVYGAGVMVPALCAGIYAWVCFGDIFAVGYQHLTQGQMGRQALLGVSYPRPDIVLELLFGSFRGLYFGAPILALCTVGLGVGLWKRARRLTWMWPCMAVCIFYVLFVSSYRWWNGGFSFGPRHFIPMLPFLCLGAFAVVERWPRVYAALAVLSALVMLCGTAYTPIIPEQMGTLDAIQGTLWGYVAEPRIYGLMGKGESTNFGLLIGLHGVTTLVPLLLAWASLGVLTWLTLRQARPAAVAERPVASVALLAAPVPAAKSAPAEQLGPRPPHKESTQPESPRPRRADLVLLPRDSRDAAPVGSSTEGRGRLDGLCPSRGPQVPPEMWVEPIPAEHEVGAGSVLLVQGWTAFPVGWRARYEVQVGAERHELPCLPDPAGRQRSDFWLPVAIGPDRIGRTERVRARLTSTRGSFVIVDQEVSFVHRAADPVDQVRTPVVVCMATYNPNLALFRRQVESLIGQTHTDWTCLVQDDCSRPAVFAEIQAICAADRSKRFVVARNPANLGFYRNFERCLARVPAGVEYVALCDQDDDWYPDKLAASLAAFAPGVELVYCDMRIVDGEGRELAPSFWTARRNNHRSFTTLLFANTVTGAASVIRRALLDKALPFPAPTGLALHDHWLALVAMTAGQLAYVDRPLYDHTQHGGNAIGHELVPPPPWYAVLAAKAQGIARATLTPRLIPGHVQANLERYASEYGRLAVARRVLALRFPDMPRAKARALDLFAGRWRDIPALILASVGVNLRHDTTSMNELSLALALAVQKTAVALSRVPLPTRESLVAEAAWWAFYLPRGGMQILARRAPLDKLRDQIPAAWAERLRFALYPGRITDPQQHACARTHAAWGDPPALDPALAVKADGEPRVSILMVTHGNLALTRLCLASLQRAAGPTSFEVIVVDNASTDGTTEVLDGIARSGLLPLSFVARRDNPGFAASTNHAARMARGEILCLLNNDTVLAPGWLERLVGHLDRDRDLGLIGPVTNSCGNEAALGTPYRDLDGMFAFARAHMDHGDRRPADIDMLTLFCAAIRRPLWDEIGGLDERYRVGMFEDDDLSVAVRLAGKKVKLARDVFVHHYGGASFATLPARRYLRIWWENRRRFEAKWGVAWKAR